uniref:Type I restriction enzyme, S subunit n=1 Tax=Candidatus Kentrum sp. SD TaxID=2126332 RepID=A0A451BJX4_9GAMM|nr:MAG: type I restriction enzyme, S subunit [Candidatus Kentron sp. SD]
MDDKPIMRLSNLIDIKHGYPFSSRYFTGTPTDYILLTPGNFTKDQRLSLQQNTTYYDGPIPDGFILQDGDLLILMTDLAREITILGSTVILQSGDINKKILHNQRIGRIIDKNHSDPAFLMYLLNSHSVRREIRVTATGSTVRHTSPAKILNAMVRAPKLPEQRRIAHILSRWDRAIFLMEQLIGAKDQRRRALVQRLLSGRHRFPKFIRSASRKTQHAYPVDWDYPRIGEIARPITEKNKEGNQLPVLSCTKHQGLMDRTRYFGKRTAQKDLSACKRARRGTFVYATNHIEEGSIGYQDLYDEALVSPMYTVFETRDPLLDRFLHLILKSERYRHIFAINTNASVDRRGGLRWKEFAKIRVPLPPRAEQEIITRLFVTVDREIHLSRQQLTALWRQKKGLMQRLLTC